MQNFNGNKLDYLIQLYAAQAKWHLQQYHNFSYYVRYYKYLKQCGCVHNQTRKSDTPYAAINSQYTGRKKKSNKKKKHALHRKELSQRDSRHNEILSKRLCQGKPNSSIELAEQIESDESGYEVNSHYLEFVRQSAEFRKERDAARLTRVSSNNTEEKDISNVCVEYVDILKKGPDGTILPPTASNRKVLYEEKYGDAGTKILSLETALQWKFNEYFDSTSPKAWPTLPIRFL